MRFLAFLEAVSSTCARGAILEVNSGIEARIQLAAKTNCCNWSPVVGDGISVSAVCRFRIHLDSVFGDDPTTPIHFSEKKLALHGV